MDRESIAIFIGAVTITLGLIAGIAYLDSRSQPPSAVRTTSTLSAKPGTPATPPSAGMSSTPVWTDTPIKCHDPEIGEFWTNARDCASADLSNRLSIAQSLQRTVPTSPPVNKSTSSSGRSQAQVKTARKPDLRRKAKRPPNDVPASCRFPLGEASELERRMSTRDDPKESIWLEKYCEWRCEVKKERCPVPRDFFYFSYDELCRYNRQVTACTPGVGP